MPSGPDTFQGGESFKTLTFEEFSTKGGNFHMFFAPIGSMMGDIYRKKPTYQNCLKEHPELETLAAELREYDFEEFDIDEQTGKPVIKPTDPERGEMMRKLYDAYLIMKPYAKRSGDLFG